MYVYFTFFVLFLQENVSNGCDIGAQSKAKEIQK